MVFLLPYCWVWSSNQKASDGHPSMAFATHKRVIKSPVLAKKNLCKPLWSSRGSFRLEQTHRISPLISNDCFRWTTCSFWKISVLRHLDIHVSMSFYCLSETPFREASLLPPFTFRIQTYICFKTSKNTKNIPTPQNLIKHVKHPFANLQNIKNNKQQ